MVGFSGYGDPGAGIVADPKSIAKMPILKEMVSSSTVAWCPLESHKSLLASGTVSGTIDDSFQTSSRLMVLNTSLSDRSLDMPVLGQARVKDADFVRIGWGAKGSTDSSMPLGLIAGGMSDGSVLFWNAKNIIDGTNRNPIVAKRHGSHVSGLAFHPTEQNLIASGSADSELLIWDLKNVSSPSASPPGLASTTEKSSVVDVAWNLKVAHILACSASNGQTSVWDLRQKRAVITFTESSHRHVPATAVAWDPTQARQLVVSYAYPAAEVWDLRYGMAPKQILQGGHSRGSILTVAWSQYDSNIILTSGEDAATCIWSANDGRLLDSVHDRGTTFCMKWHPFTAELLAGSTYEGQVIVRSISNMGSHVPAWKGRPCGATFGFGSHLVTFGNGYTQGSVRCFKVSTEPEFVRMASEFQTDIAQTDMRSFCQQRISKAEGDADERTTWQFLQLMFENNFRFQFLSRLGFTPSRPQLTASTSVAPNVPSKPESQRLDDVSDEDFFNQLSPNERSSSFSVGADAFGGVFKLASAQTAAAPTTQQADEEEADDEASSLDRRINDMLIVGDIPGAADLCAQNNRMADALAIAALGSEDLRMRMCNTYMSSHRRHYIRSIASCISSKDIPSYVKKSDLSRWNETLALIITYCPPDQYIPVARGLVERLENAGMNQAAIICCLCCSDIDGAAIQWQKQEHQQRNGKSRIDILQSSVEKLYVMSQACGQSCGPSASGLYSEYAGLLSAQGAMSMALAFLQIAGRQTDELAYRIYYSGVPPQSFAPPPQPFYVQHVAGTSSNERPHAPGRMSSSAPVGMRRGAPTAPPASLTELKTASVPPQNRMMPPNVARRSAGPISRGPPSPAMRPPFPPSNNPRMGPPGASLHRPSSVPPARDSDSSSNLPSRHLLPQQNQTVDHLSSNQFPNSPAPHPHAPPSAMRMPGRSPFPDPHRGQMSTPQSPAPGRQPGPPGRFMPPSGPTAGRMPMAANAPSGRFGPPRGYDTGISAPSPSMSPAPRPGRSPSVAPGRFGPPSRNMQSGPPPQRGGPPPSASRQGPVPSGDQVPHPSARMMRPGPGPGPDPRQPPPMTPDTPQFPNPRPIPMRPGSAPMGASMPSPALSSTPPTQSNFPNGPSAGSPYPNVGPPGRYQAPVPAPSQVPPSQQPLAQRGPAPFRGLPMRPGMPPSNMQPQPPFRPGGSSPTSGHSPFPNAPNRPHPGHGAVPPAPNTSMQPHPPQHPAPQPGPHHTSPPTMHLASQHPKQQPPSKPMRPSNQQMQSFGSPNPGSSNYSDLQPRGFGPISSASVNFPSNGLPSNDLLQSRSSAPNLQLDNYPSSQNSMSSGSMQLDSPARFADAAQSSGVSSPARQQQHPSPSRASVASQPAQAGVHNGTQKGPKGLVGLFEDCFSELERLCQGSSDHAVVNSARNKFEAELFGRMSSGALSPGAMKALESLATALQARNKSGVQQANIALITDCWAEVKTVLPVIKSIVEICKKHFD